MIGSMKTETIRVWPGPVQTAALMATTAQPQNGRRLDPAIRFPLANRTDSDGCSGGVRSVRSGPRYRRQRRSPPLPVAQDGPAEREGHGHNTDDREGDVLHVGLERHQERDVDEHRDRGAVGDVQHAVAGEGSQRIGCDG